MGSDPLGATNFVLYNVYFNDETEEITAENTSGGFSPISIYVTDENSRTVFEYIVDNTKFIFDYSPYDFRFGTGGYMQAFYPYVNVTKETIPSPPVEDLVVTATHTDETISNAKDGTITAASSGGVAPYEYSINNIDWQISNEFENLSFGTYVVFVRDSASNIGQTTVTILQGASEPPTPPEPYLKELIALEGGQLEKQGAYKRVIVRTVFGTPPATLYNGDFEKYDGQNWERWTKYGGIQLERGERTTKDASGNEVSLGNYTLKFMQRADAGKYIQHDGLDFNRGDVGTLSVNIGKTDPVIEYDGYRQEGGVFRPAHTRIQYELRFRVKVGNYYLYNDDGGDNFRWVNQLAVVSKFVDNSNGDINSYALSFRLPEAPENGKFEIYFYGFMKVAKIHMPEYRERIGGMLFVAPPKDITEDLTDYKPIEIDDVKLSKTSAVFDNEVNSIVNISDNLMNFTKTLDEIEIKFGDWLGNDNDLYAIKDQNDSYTTAWVDLGSNSSAQLPFGLNLARYIMRSFQGGYYHFRGDLLLMDDTDIHSYNDAYVFDIHYMNGIGTTKEKNFENKVFVSLAGEFDYKKSQFNGAIIRELFTRTPSTNDISIPSTPNTPLPPVFNDPNFNKESGIFTEQFTQEFE